MLPVATWWMSMWVWESLSVYCFMVRVTVAKEMPLRIHQDTPCWRGMFVSWVKVEF